MVFHEDFTVVEAEAGPCAGIFSGEEWIEDLFENVFFYSASIVAN